MAMYKVESESIKQRVETVLNEYKVALNEETSRLDELYAQYNKDKEWYGSLPLLTKLRTKKPESLKHDIPSNVTDIDVKRIMIVSYSDKVDKLERFNNELSNSGCVNVPEDLLNFIGYEVVVNDNSLVLLDQ